MKRMEKYWLMIEPYVYINIAEEGLLLYNTLDGVAIESKESEIMALVRELLCEENVGVIGLEASTLNRPDVQIFVREMREKYMGDVIDQNLLKVKPVQVLPVINYPQWRDMGCEFRLLEDWSTMLLEVTAHFPAVYSFGAGSVKDADVLSPLQEAVAFEIQHTCLHQPHYLQAFKRFSGKRNGNVVDGFVDDLDVELFFRLDAFFFKSILQVLQLAVNGKDKFFFNGLRDRFLLDEQMQDAEQVVGQAFL